MSFRKMLKSTGATIGPCGKKESTLFSQVRKKSKVLLMISGTGSKLFLIEFTFNCPKNKLLGCSDLIFFKKGKKIFLSLS